VLRLGSDADNVRYDASAKRIYAGYGEGGLAILDSGTGDDWGRVPLAAHPEAFELDAAGTTAFVNVPDLDEVAVVDLAKRCVTTTWKLEPHRANYPMALDAAGHRLFVGCRNPAAVVVLDERTGQTQTALPIDGDPDDLFFDPSDARLYAICGAGYVDVIDARPGALKIVGSVATGPGARTGLFVPELGRLFVAVPHRGSQRAEVRVFELPGAGKRDPK
jgi:DNA-binding beta-propeller fold protein YncE